MTTDESRWKMFGNASLVLCGVSLNANDASRSPAADAKVRQRFSLLRSFIGPAVWELESCPANVKKQGLGVNALCLSRYVGSRAPGTKYKRPRSTKDLSPHSVLIDLATSPVAEQVDSPAGSLRFNVASLRKYCCKTWQLLVRRVARTSRFV